MDLNKNDFKRMEYLDKKLKEFDENLHKMRYTHNIINILSLKSKDLPID